VRVDPHILLERNGVARRARCRSRPRRLDGKLVHEHDVFVTRSAPARPIRLQAAPFIVFVEIDGVDM